MSFYLLSNEQIMREVGQLLFYPVLSRQLFFVVIDRRKEKLT